MSVAATVVLINATAKTSKHGQKLAIFDLFLKFSLFKLPNRSI